MSVANQHDSHGRAGKAIGILQARTTGPLSGLANAPNFHPILTHR